MYRQKKIWRCTTPPCFACFQDRLIAPCGCVLIPCWTTTTMSSFTSDQPRARASSPNRPRAPATLASPPKGRRVTRVRRFIHRCSTSQSPKAKRDGCGWWTATRNVMILEDAQGRLPLHGLPRSSQKTLRPASHAATRFAGTALFHFTPLFPSSRPEALRNRPLYLLLSGFARGQALGCHAVARADRMQKSMQTAETRKTISLSF